MGQVHVRDRTIIETGSSPISATKKQRFLDATKTLLDIANEASNVFPPLKSCLGGLNALIKYYEVRLPPIARDLTDVSLQGCKDVEDNLRDLVLWLTKLKDNLATTSSDNNHEEAKRRNQLTRFPSISLSCYQLKLTACCRSLEGIQERSRRLLDKGKGARILDKRRDSGAIVKLVEELRQATLLYQGEMLTTGD